MLSKLHIPANAIQSFCQRHHIRKLSLFGSAVSNSFRLDSDVDILVEFETDHIPGLIRLSEMELELSELLSRKADLRTPEDLSRYFREEVMRKAEVQYVAG
jgi:uncharacterized protein